MASLRPVQSTTHQETIDTPTPPTQLSPREFCKIEGIKKVIQERAVVYYSSSDCLVAPVTNGIVLFAVHLLRIQQRVDWYGGYHMTYDITPQNMNDFIDCLDPKSYLLRLYLIGGNKEHAKHEDLYKKITEALKSKFKKTDATITELIGLINHPQASAKVLSVALKKDGEIVWCFGNTES